jgi:UDP-glucose 4-epimerase
MLLGLKKSTEQVEICNVGSEDQTNVKTIAEVVAEEMGLQDIKFKFTGGVDGGRGWKGYVKNMLLNISKIKSLGWKPEHNTRQAIREATQRAITELLKSENT